MNLKSKKINIKKDKLLLSIIAVIMSLYFSFSLTLFTACAENLRDDVVRLHILANSDSKNDQDVKLMVRDALLSLNTRMLKSGVSKENAVEYFNESKDLLEKTANDVLKNNGFGYKAEVKLENEYFETRSYGSLMFPAGDYLSLKVVLGDGKGHNWWCVMFPPMCLPAAQEVINDEETAEKYFSEKEEKLISGGKKYIIKFKIVEIYEELMDKIKG